MQNLKEKIKLENQEIQDHDPHLLHLGLPRQDRVHHHHLQSQYSHCIARTAATITTVQNLKEKLKLENQEIQDHDPHHPKPNHIAVQLYNHLSHELPHPLPHHCPVQPQHSSPLDAPDRTILRKKTYMRIQNSRKCRDSTIKEEALVSKIPPTETTLQHQPKPPIPEQRRAKLNSENKTTIPIPQQQTKQVNDEENKKTTTNTSENKTTIATRVSRIADIFKNKQQEHELKQMQQTTRITTNKMKPRNAEENKNNKKSRQTTQETPKVKKTIAKTKTPVGKQNNKNNQKLQQTLKDMWKNENLKKNEKQEKQETTENEANKTSQENEQHQETTIRKPEKQNKTTSKQTTIPNTTNETTNEQNKQETKPAIKDLKTKQVAKTTTKRTKQVTDIQELKLFLAKKKQERAQNGTLQKIVASSSTQPLNPVQSSARSSRYDGDRTSQTKPGDKNIAAKGEQISAGISDWLESTTRPVSNQ